MVTVANNFEYEFPKANEFKPERHKGLFLIEEKLDGESIIIARGQAYGRRLGISGLHMNKWDTMPKKIKSLAHAHAVHGELYVEEGTSSDVKTAIKEANEGGGPLADRLNFCAYRLVGQSFRPHEHLNVLKQMGFAVPRVYCELRGGRVALPALISWGEKIPDLDTYYWSAPQGLDLRHIARENKIEGFMLKKQDTLPVWFKLKVEDTADVIVTGVKEGDGKYLGLVGALLCSVINPDGSMTEVASVSGMTDDERYEITEMFDVTKNLIGRVIEIKYQCVAAQGRLRHPRFLRFREDKNPMECTIDQLAKDL